VFLVDKVRSGRGSIIAKTPKVKREESRLSTSPDPSDTTHVGDPESVKTEISVEQLVPLATFEASTLQEALLYLLTNQNLRLAQPIGVGLPQLSLPPLLNSTDSLDTFVGSFSDYDGLTTAATSVVEAPCYFARQEGHLNQFVGHTTSGFSGFTFDEPKHQDLAQLDKMMLY